MNKILLLLVLALGGCATHKDMSHGVLVDDWFVSTAPNGKFTQSLYWDGMSHQCQYKDGSIIGVGRQPCP